MVATFAASRAGMVHLAALLAGAACALDPRALFAVPFLLGPPRGRARLGPAIVGMVLGYVALVAPLLLADRQAFAERFAVGGPLEPGVGLSNLLLYGGVEATGWVAATPFVAGAACLALLRLSLMPPLAAAALAMLVAQWLGPGVSPEALAVPLVLLVLAALDEPEVEVVVVNGS
jgi:hypothetical protein